jgi:hypothetical protein
LADLQVLAERWCKIETLQSNQINRGDNPTEVDRDAALLSLNCIAQFLWTPASNPNRLSDC